MRADVGVKRFPDDNRLLVTAMRARKVDGSFDGHGFCSKPVDAPILFVRDQPELSKLRDLRYEAFERSCQAYEMYLAVFFAFSIVFTVAGPFHRKSLRGLKQRYCT
jgi:hypothetical protein